MYELPDQLDLNELVGQEINQICVGPYDAQIAFEKGTVIHILYKLEGEIGGTRTLWFNGNWVNTSQIIHVPKQVVSSVTAISKLLLKIVLSNGVALYIHTEVSPYESINISHASGAIEII